MSYKIDKIFFTITTLFLTITTGFLVFEIDIWNLIFVIPIGILILWIQDVAFLHGRKYESKRINGIGKDDER
jgi:hypothetical protein